MAKHIIGIDMGATSIKGGLVDLSGRIVKEKTIPTRANKKRKEIVSELFDVIDNLMSKSVVGIGIGVPSILDIKKGFINETHNIPSFKKIPLKKILEKKYSTPVSINNDANCFAFGEKYYGKGKRYHNIVGIILGSGFGVGIIINDKIYAGRR